MFQLENVRVSMDDPSVLLCYGFYPRETNEGEISVILDGKTVTGERSRQDDPGLKKHYLVQNFQADTRDIWSFRLPSNWKTARKLQVVQKTEEQQEIVRTFLMPDIRNMAKGPVTFFLDSASREDDVLILKGWQADRHLMNLFVHDAGGKKLDVECMRSFRGDIRMVFPEMPEDFNAGFELHIKNQASITWPLTVVFAGNNGVRKKYEFTKNKIDLLIRRQQPSGKLGMIYKGLRAVKRTGLKNTFRLALNYARHGRRSTYEQWIRKYDVTERDLQNQKKITFLENLKVSIVIPLYRTKPEFLIELIRSLQAQSYSNWELCMADASGEPSPLTALLTEESENDPRVRFCTLKENGGISENTNAAIAMATGDLIAFTDHDDLLAPNAMFEVINAIHKDPEIDVLYSDEDKIDLEGAHRFDPNFKPDFNQDLLNSVNYICHLFVVRKEIIDKVGVLRKEFDGAQDYDFIFRATEAAKKIHHIPKMLYHWRAHPDSTAENPESKLYAFEAGKRAIQAHYERCGIPAEVTDMAYYGTYRSVYHWQEEPLLSIMIPNKDHTEDLDKCVRSILEKSTYSNFEILVIENNSEDPKTFEYYKKLEAEDPRVRVVYFKGEFNFSRINNFGAENAKGDYLLLLNNDTEMIAPESLAEMMGYAMREDVGIVGARLYFADETIQHCGVIVGIAGFAGHCFVNLSRYDVGYMNRIVTACDYSAVTAACLLTKRSVYEAVGGMTEDFKVALNDIDYCLKVRELGKTVVYDPYAEFYHYESKSRGYEVGKDKQSRFDKEVQMFRDKWKTFLDAGDPMYNPNLTLERLDFSPKD